MRKMKCSMSIFTLMICILLSGCGRKYTIPNDWVYLTNEEALNHYKEIDFTLENVTEGFVTMEKSVKYYNEWDELEGEKFSTVWGPSASNIIVFDSDENTFLMDCKYTKCTQKVKLNPETLEVIEIMNERSLETEETWNAYPWNGITLSSYSISYNADGSILLNDEGELIVDKVIIKDFKVERVKGHGEWMENIPDEYMMNTAKYSAARECLKDPLMTFLW